MFSFLIKKDTCRHISAWWRARRTNTWQMLLVLLGGCREILGNDGTMLGSQCVEGDSPGSNGTGSGDFSMAGSSAWGENDGTSESRAGRKGNKYLAPASGRKPDEAFLSQRWNTTLTVTQEDLQQPLHKASVKNTESLDILHLKTFTNVAVFRIPKLLSMTRKTREAPEDKKADIVPAF